MELTKEDLLFIKGVWDENLKGTYNPTDLNKAYQDGFTVIALVSV